MTEIELVFAVIIYGFGMLSAGFALGYCIKPYCLPFKGEIENEV